MTFGSLNFKKVIFEDVPQWVANVFHIFFPEVCLDKDSLVQATKMLVNNIVGLAKQRTRPPLCIIPAPITYMLQSVRNLLDIFGMRMGPLLLPSPPSLRALISMR